MSERLSSEVIGISPGRRRLIRVQSVDGTISYVDPHAIQAVQSVGQVVDDDNRAAYVLHGGARVYSWQPEGALVATWMEAHDPDWKP